jgi:hypothetical protein
MCCYACVQVFGQILFSGSLFLFWLVYADGMSSASRERHFCTFYVPKLLLVCTYVGVAATMFVLHGRVPDRINMADVSCAQQFEEGRGGVHGDTKIRRLPPREIYRP